MQELLKYKPFIAEVKKCISLEELSDVVDDFVPQDSILTWVNTAVNYRAFSDEMIQDEFAAGKLSALLTCGLDPNFTFKDGTNLIFNAILLKDVAAVKLLQQHQVDMSLFCDVENKAMPLTAAAKSKK